MYIYIIVKPPPGNFIFYELLINRFFTQCVVRAYSSACLCDMSVWRNDHITKHALMSVRTPSKYGSNALRKVVPALWYPSK